MDSIRARLPHIIERGEEFSKRMAQWCSTSKFLSSAARPDSCGYQDVYGQVLRGFAGHSLRILEIGIGINDPAVPSGMAVGHVPGSSLMGLSRFFPGSEVHGADVDRRCLIDALDYKTHYVNQLEPETIVELADRLGGVFDLIIDDGLHTPEANGNVIRHLAPRLKPNGVLVIEDIVPQFDDLWAKAVARIAKPYELTFYPCSALRQSRGACGVGMAIVTRRFG